MRRRKIIIVASAGLLAVTLSVFLITHDSGLSPVVYGNFSAGDVAQIRAAVRRQLWREVLPSFSMESLKAFPRQVKRALTTRVGRISEEGPTAGRNREAYVIFAGPPNVAPSGYILTNGTSGWHWQYAYIYVLPD